MSFSEADTRAKPIDSTIYRRGWTEDLIRREVTVGAILIAGGKPKRGQGRVDYFLRVKVPGAGQSVALALIEVKAEHLPPGHLDSPTSVLTGFCVVGSDLCEWHGSTDGHDPRLATKRLPELPT